MSWSEVRYSDDFAGGGFCRRSGGESLSHEDRLDLEDRVSLFPGESISQAAVRVGVLRSGATFIAEISPLAGARGGAIEVGAKVWAGDPSLGFKGLLRLITHSSLGFQDISRKERGHLAIAAASALLGGAVHLRWARGGSREAIAALLNFSPGFAMREMDVATSPLLGVNARPAIVIEEGKEPGLEISGAERASAQNLASALIEFSESSHDVQSRIRGDLQSHSSFDAEAFLVALFARGQGSRNRVSDRMIAEASLPGDVLDLAWHKFRVEDAVESEDVLDAIWAGSDSDVEVSRKILENVASSLEESVPQLIARSLRRSHVERKSALRLYKEGVIRGDDSQDALELLARDLIGDGALSGVPWTPDEISGVFAFERRVRESLDVCHFELANRARKFIYGHHHGYRGFAMILRRFIARSDKAYQNWKEVWSWLVERGCFGKAHTWEGSMPRKGKDVENVIHRLQEQIEAGAPRWPEKYAEDLSGHFAKSHRTLELAFRVVGEALRKNPGQGDNVVLFSKQSLSRVNQIHRDEAWAREGNNHQGMLWRAPMLKVLAVVFVLLCAALAAAIYWAGPRFFSGEGEATSGTEISTSDLGDSQDVAEIKDPDDGREIDDSAKTNPTGGQPVEGP